MLETAGAWKVQPDPPPPPPPAPAALPQESVLNQQFVELFTTAERPVVADSLVQSAQRPQSAAPVRPPEPVLKQTKAEPGEFTRMFQSPAVAAPPAPAPRPRRRRKPKPRWANSRKCFRRQKRPLRRRPPSASQRTRRVHAHVPGEPEPRSRAASAARGSENQPQRFRAVIRDALSRRAHATQPRRAAAAHSARPRRFRAKSHRRIHADVRERPLRPRARSARSGPVSQGARRVHANVPFAWSRRPPPATQPITPARRHRSSRRLRQP